jgi:hypothetical protein
MTTHEAIPNTGETLNPTSANHPTINMTGFRHVLLGIKTTSAGNYRFDAVGGPESFANLSPTNAGDVLRFINGSNYSGSDDFANTILDATEPLNADVWHILAIYDRLQYLENVQFKITNNSGSEATMNTAFMRLV